jgi:glycosyltransferase involved in cell wall biosynthesis
LAVKAEEREPDKMPSIVIPANNESATLGPCLDSLVAQTFIGPVEIIVSANACIDNTIAVAESRRKKITARGWKLIIIDRPNPGKTAALNAADAVTTYHIKIYLDADVICSDTLITELVKALDTNDPRYASGTLTLTPSKSWVTRQFGKTWEKLPFMRTNVPGAGVFAVNETGRGRWGAFPNIISDDGYVRLLFKPSERVRVPSTYSWPLAEGFVNLVRVRRRQDAGNLELSTKYPELLINESKRKLTMHDHLLLFASRPISYFIYVILILAVRYGPRADTNEWARGR